MMRRLALCLLWLVFLLGASAKGGFAADAPASPPAPAPAAAAAAMAYDLVGTDAAPGNAEYKGVVTIERKDSTVVVTWKVENETYVGTGIVDGNAMAVVFGGDGDDDEAGVGLYIRDPQTEVVSGRWTIKGETMVGTERWTPRK